MTTYLVEVWEGEPFVSRSQRAYARMVPDGSELQEPEVLEGLLLWLKKRSPPAPGQSATIRRSDKPGNWDGQVLMVLRETNREWADG